jgi:hypothetical protein
LADMNARGRAGAVAPWLVAHGRTKTGRGGGPVRGMLLGERARIICPKIRVAGPLESPFRSRDPQTWCRRGEKMGGISEKTVCPDFWHKQSCSCLSGRRGGGGGGTLPPCEEAGPHPACLLRDGPQTENAPPHPGPMWAIKKQRQMLNEGLRISKIFSWARNLFEHEKAPWRVWALDAASPPRMVLSVSSRSSRPVRLPFAESLPSAMSSSRLTVPRLEATSESQHPPLCLDSSSKNSVSARHGQPTDPLCRGDQWCIASQRSDRLPRRDKAVSLIPGAPGSALTLSVK